MPNGTPNDERRQCTATLRLTGGTRCIRPACKGSHVCELHGGRSPLARAQARLRLLAMVEPAFEMLLKAMESEDIKSGVRAAEVILDRAGFGPKSTLVVEDNRDNLANMTKEELAKRAMELAERARRAAQVELEPETPTSGTVN